jgi:hypothetical protein
MVQCRIPLIIQSTLGFRYSDLFHSVEAVGPWSVEFSKNSKSREIGLPTVLSEHDQISSSFFGSASRFCLVLDNSLTKKLSSRFLHSSIAWSDPYRMSDSEASSACQGHAPQPKASKFHVCSLSSSPHFLPDLMKNILPSQAQFLKVHDKEAKITRWTKVTKPHFLLTNLMLKNLLCHGYLPICPGLVPVGIVFFHKQRFPLVRLRDSEEKRWTGVMEPL